MSVAERRRQGGDPTVESTLTNLSLSKSGTAGQRKKQKDVADSWEDASSSESEEGPSTPTAQQLPTSTGHPNAPPPTPASPSAVFDNPYALPSDFSNTSSRGTRGEQRPDKTTSAASRMIAGALGVRAPRKGEEMRQFEQAAIDKERARKERERTEKENEEQRKKSVWDD